MRKQPRVRVYKTKRGINPRENGSAQRTSFLDTVNTVALFIYLFYFIFLFISLYRTHNRVRIQIKCALGGGDSPQHRH